MKIKDKDRSGFLQKEFGDCVFDILTFNFADQMVPEYNGGYWEYYKEGSVPFLTPFTDDEIVTMQSMFTGDTVQVPGLLAGKIITFFALLYHIEKFGDEDKIDLLDKIKDNILNDVSDLNRMDIWMTLLD